MKLNARIIDYVALIQEGRLTVEEVPQDISKVVTDLLRNLSGVTADNGMVQDTEPAVNANTNPTPDTASSSTSTVSTTPGMAGMAGLVNDTKVGD